MPEQNQDVTVWQSDHFEIAITVKDAAGQPVDLTGASAEWWCADRAAGTTSAPRRGGTRHIRKTVGSGITLTQASGLWTLRIALVPADTENLPAGTYYHEAEIVDVAGNHSTVAVGNLTVRPTAIRP